MSRLEVGSVIRCKSATDMLSEMWDLDKLGYVTDFERGHLKDGVFRIHILQDLDKEV